MGVLSITNRIDLLTLPRSCICKAYAEHISKFLHGFASYSMLCSYTRAICSSHALIPGFTVSITLVLRYAYYIYENSYLKISLLNYEILHALCINYPFNHNVYICR